MEFLMSSQYHPPFGRQKRGTHTFCWISKCSRWHVRVGNFGTMIVRDRHHDVVHVVVGEMPDVIDFFAVTPDPKPVKVRPIQWYRLMAGDYVSTCGRFAIVRRRYGCGLKGFTWLVTDRHRQDTLQPQYKAHRACTTLASAKKNAQRSLEKDQWI